MKILVTEHKEDKKVEKTVEIPNDVDWFSIEVLDNSKTAQYREYIFDVQRGFKTDAGSGYEYEVIEVKDRVSQPEANPQKLSFEELVKHFLENDYYMAKVEVTKNDLIIDTVMDVIDNKMIEDTRTACYGRQYHFILQDKRIKIYIKI